MARIDLTADMSKATGFAKDWVGGFKTFLTKNNVLGLAVAVVIGGAVGKVVSGIVDDLIMPIIGVVLPAGDWRKAELVLSGTNAIKYGDLLGRLVDFGIVALVVYFIIRTFLERSKPAAVPTTRSCPECLEAIPLAARKCRACGSAVVAVA